MEHYTTERESRLKSERVEEAKTSCDRENWRFLCQGQLLDLEPPGGIKRHRQGRYEQAQGRCGVQTDVLDKYSRFGNVEKMKRKRLTKRI